MNASYVTARRVAELARLTGDREWSVLLTLGRVRVATVGQLERLHFRDVSRRQARSVLASMAGRRLLARLPRAVGGVRAGSAGYVYVLDVAGQRLSTPAGSRRPARPWPVGTLFLAHSLAVTELLVRLAEAEASGESDVVLRLFRGEPACWRGFASPGGGQVTLKPDAEVVLGLGQYEDRWFVEVDRATESGPTLARKAELYVRYWQTGAEQARTGVFPRVLWIVPDSARQSALTQILERSPAETWQLFAVATEADAVGRLLGGAGL